jgi:hypothetical protein
MASGISGAVDLRSATTADSARCTSGVLSRAWKQPGTLHSLSAFHPNIRQRSGEPIWPGNPGT